MNGNSSKQVLLSVLGIAVLVVAVVGVSFAFFTYSKNGTSNNTLTTGSIFFNFVEGDRILLENQFPIDETAGMALSKDDNGMLEFSVLGYDGSATGITYTVKAFPGSVAATTPFKDSEIKLYLVDDATYDGHVNNFASPALVSSQGKLSEGIVLAQGEITATSADQQQEDSYELRMWIDDAVVSVNAQETAGDGDSEYNTTEFGEMYYSLTLKVDAASTVTP